MQTQEALTASTGDMATIVSFVNSYYRIRISNLVIRSFRTNVMFATTPTLEGGGGSVNLTSSGPQCTSKQALIGGIGVVVAIGMFGTNLIPVKKIDTGDGAPCISLSCGAYSMLCVRVIGMFFQWMMCIGIWLVGLVINFIQQQPPFFYASVLGGFLWTTGGCVTPTWSGWGHTYVVLL